MSHLGKLPIILHVVANSDDQTISSAYVLFLLVQAQTDASNVHPGLCSTDPSPDIKHIASGCVMIKTLLYCSILWMEHGHVTT